MRILDLTDQEFVDAITNSSSIRQVLIGLNLNYRGAGNYKTVRNRIKQLSLNTDHFVRGSKLVTINGLNVVPTEKHLVLNKDGYGIGTSSLKNRLFRDGFKHYQCEKCGISEWNGEKAPLELHHINCNPSDNRIENLIILCANCHMIEHRIIIRNRKADIEKNRIQIRVKHIADKYCDICGTKIHKKSKYCLRCYGMSKRKIIERPSKNILIDLIGKNGYSAVGRMYGVSDNAIRKWLRNMS